MTVKDKLREHVHFWREEKAPESVIDVIEKGYVLPLLLGSTVVSPYVGMGRKQMAATMQVLAFKR